MAEKRKRAKKQDNRYVIMQYNIWKEKKTHRVCCKIDAIECILCVFYVRCTCQSDYTILLNAFFSSLFWKMNRQGTEKQTDFHQNARKQFKPKCHHTQMPTMFPIIPSNAIDFFHSIAKIQQKMSLFHRAATDTFSPFHFIRMDIIWKMNARMLADSRISNIDQWDQWKGRK